MAILISYRNEDSPMLSNQLYTALTQRMGARNFIFGVDNLIEFGDLPKTAIEAGIQKCDLLLVFIGQNWTSTNWSHNPNDQDVLAIITAQATNKRIIPVHLIDGLQIDKDGLSPSVASLLDRAPFICKNEDDVVKLTQTLQKHLNTSQNPSQTTNAFIPTQAPIDKSVNTTEITNLEQNAIIGEINVSTGYQDLFVVPFDTANIRTKIPNGVYVIILARDEVSPWLNVVYISTTGQPTSGWIPISAIRHIHYRNNAVEMMDIPVSTYEYNTVEEVKLLKKQFWKNRNRVVIKYFRNCVILSFIILSLLGILIRESHSPLEVIIMLSGVPGATLFWIPTLFFSPKYKEISKQMARLNPILAMKRSGGTNMLETITKVGLAAGNVVEKVVMGALAMEIRSRRNSNDF